MARAAQGCSRGGLYSLPPAVQLAHRDVDTQDGQQRGPDGRFQPLEQVLPLPEDFIGGFNPAVRPATPGPPLPPKDEAGVPPSPHYVAHSPLGLPPTSWAAAAPGGNGELRQPSVSSMTSQFTHMSAVERSQTLRVAKMNPHLQFMCGPLLRYDTVDERGVWLGAALIVSKYHVL